MLAPQANDLGRAILSRDDAAHLEQLAIQSGMITHRQRALAAVESGQTSPAEIRRAWKADKTFKPKMSGDDRARELSKWKRAVERA